MSVIVEKSGIPIFAKKSFLTTIPEVNGHRIVFYTDSEFHREKLSDSGTHNKILTACKDIFQSPDLTVDFVKKAGMAKATPKNTATVDDFLSFWVDLSAKMWYNGWIYFLTPSHMNLAAPRNFHEFIHAPITLITGTALCTTAVFCAYHVMQNAEGELLLSTAIANLMSLF